jgi:hypothetical protein
LPCTAGAGNQDSLSLAFAYVSTTPAAPPLPPLIARQGGERAEKAADLKAEKAGDAEVRAVRRLTRIAVEVTENGRDDDECRKAAETRLSWVMEVRGVEVGQRTRTAEVFSGIVQCEQTG